MLAIQSINKNNTKISEIENKVSDLDHDKYITTSEFNKLTFLMQVSHKKIYTGWNSVEATIY